MTADNSEPPPPPLPATPIELSYSNLQGARPAVITASGMIGIIIALLGFFSAWNGISQPWSSAIVGDPMPLYRRATSDAFAVTMCESFVGAALATTLMTGSVGLIRYRPWSRRVMLWWAWLYLLSVLIFLMLQIMIVVPGMSAMYTRLYTQAAKEAATMPAKVATPPGTASSTTSPTAVFPAAPTPAQSAATLDDVYDRQAVNKAVVCLIFPIVMLIVLHLKRVRAAVASWPPRHAHQPTICPPLI